MAPGIVGREAQLLEVERFLDVSAAGFAVLVLGGDAGIGKTRSVSGDSMSGSYSTSAGGGTWSAHKA